MRAIACGFRSGVCVLMKRREVRVGRWRLVFWMLMLRRVVLKLRRVQIDSSIGVSIAQKTLDSLSHRDFPGS